MVIGTKLAVASSSVSGSVVPLKTAWYRASRKAEKIPQAEIEARPGVHAEIGLPVGARRIIADGLHVVAADPADQVRVELALLGALELEHCVRRALNQLPVRVDVLRRIDPEATVHPIDLNPDREIGRLEADGGHPVPSGPRHVVEGAGGQGGTAADGESELGHCRGMHCYGEETCHQYDAPESSHKLSCRVAYWSGSLGKR